MYKIHEINVKSFHQNKNYRKIYRKSKSWCIMPTKIFTNKLYIWEISVHILIC